MYKDNLEHEVEKCLLAIEYILDYEEFPDNFSVDKTVAHYLDVKGHYGWVNVDEFSGPETNEISQLALKKVAEKNKIYNGTYKLEHNTSGTNIDSFIAKYVDNNTNFKQDRYKRKFLTFRCINSEAVPQWEYNSPEIKN